MKPNLPILALAAAGCLCPALPAAEVIEITKGTAGDLPGGKEADGIIGDFLLRNDSVEAVISHNAPLRRANMSTFYGEGGVTPGCLYDLTLRGAENDQITIFAPAGQRGNVSWVREITDGLAAGEAGVETVVTAASGGGVYRKHRYLLRESTPLLRIETTFRNESGDPKEVTLDDTWTGLGKTGSTKGVRWGESVDPADRAGYATRGGGGKKTLAPGEEFSWTRVLAVAESPAAAAGLVLLHEEGEGAVGVARTHVRGPGGMPVAGARVAFDWGGDAVVPSVTGDDGFVSVWVPRGNVAVEAEAPGRGKAETTLEVAGPEWPLGELVLGPPTRIAFDVRDGAGTAMPCKVQFIGQGETKSPDLGPQNRAHGCRNQYHSESGEFVVDVPPGDYRVVVTRGPEFSHHAADLSVPAGETVAVVAKLERLVDSAGWVSTDYHNHSTPSGDNTCGTNDRLINLAAEHIEFAPTTEHNRLYDWTPHIEALGLSPFLATVPGMELTGRGAHINAFPLKPVPRTQDGGAPVWEADPRVSALHLREWQGGDPDRWVHLNHPDMVDNFIDRDGDGKTDGGFAMFGGMLDGLETENYITDFAAGYGILAEAPYRLDKALEKGARVRMIREFIWLQLLNQGVRVWGIAVADAHSVFGNGVGGWRTYVPSSRDDPAALDWRELVRNSKAGQMVLTTGPFLEVTVDGELPGADIAAADGTVDVAVKVQTTDWMDVDRIQVLVNGRQRPDLNFTRSSHPDWFGDGVVKFDRTFPVALTGDSHLIVVAMGEDSDLSTGFGASPQAKMNPCAYHNPVFVDTDGNGFEANGDTLGFPLPVAGLTPDHVRALLGE